ncbi:MAG: amidase [Gemmatimonadetes bacterium]|nr:amidase [Gemmatimonadota bacterium]MXX72934.1 amidase [Gemmatimonadota bacterium]MYC91472.1 amidase [Gemmatimonadota bacterium]MYG36592.1 amidase [Gemmatimonadota bacterium]
MPAKPAVLPRIPLRRLVWPAALSIAVLAAVRADAADQPIDVVELTATELQEGYAAGAYTVVEVVQAFLDRIERYEGHYNAFVSMNPDALAIAAGLDEELRTTGPRGPLHGVPVVIKDNLDYAGLVTTAGFNGFSAATGGVDMVPGDDAVAVERLRDAGAVILGKTNMPDFAAHGTRTRSTVAGETLNPYALDRVPGGSSGGTATAVNASFAVLGLGTETGGSIQNPAAAQALVGVKPTFGLVPLEGVVPSDATYRDVVGPLARTVRDAAVTLDVIAGPSPEDLASYAGAEHIPDSGYEAALSVTAIRGKRFGLVGQGWRESFLPLAPGTEALYSEAVQVLEAEGGTVVEDPFAGRGWVELYGDRPGVPSVGSHDLAVYLQGLGPDAAFHSVEEWEELSGRRFRGGRGRRLPVAPTATEEGDAFQAWRREMRALFRAVLADNELDGLFFPQAGEPIRPLVEDPERPDYRPNNHAELPSNIINDIGLPTVAVPFAYYDDGTPFVLAFIGDLWTDAELIAYAYDIEQATLARVPPTLVEGPR